MARGTTRHELHCPMCKGRGFVVTEQTEGNSPQRFDWIACPVCNARISIPTTDGHPIRVEVSGRQATEVRDVLTSTLRELRQRKGDDKLNEQLTESTDVAIVVALDEELEAVLGSAGPWERHQTPSDIRTYYTTKTSTGLSVVAARASGMGQLNAALLVRDIVSQFAPRKVILVGIAGGLGKEISLGDIVVSDQIVDYELGKVTKGGATPRWSVYRITSNARSGSIM